MLLFVFRPSEDNSVCGRNFNRTSVEHVTGEMRRNMFLQKRAEPVEGQPVSGLQRFETLVQQLHKSSAVFLCAAFGNIALLCK